MRYMRQALDWGDGPWLFAVATIVIVPHLFTAPGWLVLVSTLIVFWAVLLWWKNSPSPHPWLLSSIVGLLTLGMYLEYRTLFGNEVGVSTLLALLALKLLEIRSLRDHYVIIMLSYFLLFAYFFHSQTPLTVVWMLAALVVLTASLIRLHARGLNHRFMIQRAGLLLLVALPFMVVLYLLFPRAAGPLWSLSSSKVAETRGLSESMSPGDIASLATNDNLAFRVGFVGPPPPPSERYWRGLVMEHFDGREWRYQAILPTATAITAQEVRYRYQLSLEASDANWLPSLELTARLSLETPLGAAGLFRYHQPVGQRLIYHGEASPTARLGISEHPLVLRRNLNLPAKGNPKARALALSWLQQGYRGSALVANSLRWLRQASLVYTLRPALLGEDSVDAFLFTSKSGFCEHFASSFVFLMRAAGIPARVVAGYQGGEINPINGLMSIRQSDAHAWAEVWLPEQGWQRVDPTATVTPDRILHGAATTLAAGDVPTRLRNSSRWLQSLYYQWEALEAKWNLWIIGYNRDRQHDFLLRLGFDEISWSVLFAWLIGLLSLMFLLLFLFEISRRQGGDAVAHTWRSTTAALARLGLPIYPGLPPLALNRVCRQAPAPIETRVADMVTAYCDCRYRGDTAATTRFYRAAGAVRKLVRRHRFYRLIGRHGEETS